MSNIPRAKAILKDALENASHALSLEAAIREALPLLDRRKPEFVAKSRIPALTFRQKQQARKMRDAGLPLHTIALNLGTNHGRVSEALSESA